MTLMMFTSMWLYLLSHGSDDVKKSVLASSLLCPPNCAASVSNTILYLRKEGLRLAKFCLTATHTEMNNYQSHGDVAFAVTCQCK